MKSTRSLPLIAVAILALTAAPAAAATYDIDPVHSSAVFKIKHFNTSNFYGVFKSVNGTIEFDPSDAAKSSIEVTIAADSVDTRNDRRTDHVKSPDFLNAKQFPTITFKSSSVKSVGGDKFEVSGKLTLLGVTKDITVQVEKVGEGKHPRSGQELIGFETRFAVDRTDYDMNFMAGPLGEEVTFLLSLEAGKK